MSEVKQTVSAGQPKRPMPVVHGTQFELDLDISAGKI
jgi:hypothetical protein